MVGPLRAVLASVLAILFTASGSIRAVQPGQDAPPASAAETRALLDRYCVSCHNQRLKTAELSLDTLDLSRVGEHADVWEKVVRKLHAQVMPPVGRPRPDRAGYDRITSWLETELDRAAAAHPNPGRPAVFHRLNRSEYRNAVRDLLALDVDVAALLPADTSSYGFDNIGDVLRLSPSLLDRYLSAARKISQLAVGDPAIGARIDTYVVRSDLTQNDRLDGMPFGTRGGTLIRHDFPLDGEYDIRIRLARDYNGFLLGLGEPHQLEVAIDGARVKLFTVGMANGAKRADENMRLHGDEELDLRLPVKSGQRQVSVTFLKRPASEFEALRKPWIRAIVEQGETNGLPYLSKVIIGGPYEATGPSDTVSRARIFSCRPTAAAAESACARAIASRLARHAYRRPVTPAELQVLLQFYDEGRAAGGFEKGIERVLSRILMSPSFLFRIEPDPPGVAPNVTYPVTDLELASRLSFFLWSSIPDEELLDLAVRGKLKEPAILEQQVRRMLADARTQALVENFAGQWLYLRNLQDVKPDERLYPDFDENLRQGFRKETELFVGSVLRENRSAMDLLTANYTFVNERLARHYGIPNVYGDHFRRVTLPDDTRGGLLGHGSILTVRSYATRTSPVLRGVWILENLLGVAVPPPPPNVPDLKDKNPQGTVLSMRERMVQHRANPVCSSCHAVMDPLGLPLENYDAVGKWRTVNESNSPVDASGGLPDGTTFDGVAGLRKALLGHSREFVTTLTEKLLTYGLGRGLESSDAPAVRRIAAAAAARDYQLSAIISGIVSSVPFQMKRSIDHAASPPPGAVQ